MTVKYQLMDEEKACYPVVMMARVLGLARQGYYQWKRAQETSSGPSWREQLAEDIVRLWEVSKHRHGFRRIAVDLAKEGKQVSWWLVGKIMAEQGIQGLQPRTSKKTTVPDPDAPTRPDLVRRHFLPPVATTVLVGDITYLRTGEGWLYLATVIDLTTRMVVGWDLVAERRVLADHMRSSLAVDALRMAHQAGCVAGNAIFHTDRGSQYTSKEMTLAAASMDVRLSCGRTGVCWDNAVAESFFSMLKNEMYYQHSFPTRAKARLEVATYIEVYYNRQRPHSTLGYRTPVEAMADHTPQTGNEEQLLAA
jgi:transposase InsO family protein